MKLSELESEYLSRITKGLAKKLDCDALDELANEMRSDLKSESDQDPNEDRENDVEWNNRPNQFI